MDLQEELQLAVEKFNEAYLAWSEKHGQGANFKWIYNNNTKQLFLDGASPLVKPDAELQGKAHAAALALDAELKKVSPVEEVLSTLKRLKVEDVSHVTTEKSDVLGVDLLDTTTITAVVGPTVFKISATRHS